MFLKKWFFALLLAALLLSSCGAPATPAPAPPPPPNGARCARCAKPASINDAARPAAQAEAAELRMRSDAGAVAWPTRGVGASSSARPTSVVMAVVGERVTAIVDLEQPIQGEMRVPLGRREARVSEHFLNRAEVRAPF